MADKEPLLIEQTAKRLKLIRGIGIVLMVLAIIPAAVFSDEYGPTTIGYVLGGIVGVIGIGCWGAGMMLSWWHHG